MHALGGDLGPPYEKIRDPAVQRAARFQHRLCHPARETAASDHQIVFARRHRLVTAGIALASRAPIQLAVDPCSFMAFGRQYMETARFRNAWWQFDVCTPSGHVRGDGDTPALSGPRDN